VIAQSRVVISTKIGAPRDAAAINQGRCSASAVEGTK
jgi:hypothetical protein